MANSPKHYKQISQSDVRTQLQINSTELTEDVKQSTEVQQEEVIITKLSEKPTHKRQTSLFDNTTVNIQEELKHHEELNQKDITEMLKKQKEFQYYGKLFCCHSFLFALSKIKIWIFNILLCAGGLVVSYFLTDRNETLSDRVFFYTIYLSFLIFCVCITGLIVNYIIMKILIRYTRDTWKVFYIKGIKNRLHLSLLSILWFAGFWWFGEYINYDYNENIFSTILCVFISSTAFLTTHLFIRYTALNGYFDIFKIEARKLKTYVTMIEMMADIPKKRKENKAKNKANKKKVKKKKKKVDKSISQKHLFDNKSEFVVDSEKERLFSIPVMNFLIDFPSTHEKNKAKKERQKKVSFRLLKEDRDTVEKISNHIIKHDKSDKKQKKSKIIETQKHSTDNIEKHVNDPLSQITDNSTDNNIGAFDKWLQTKGLELMKKPLNMLNIQSMKDLQEFLSDLYNDQFGYHEYDSNNNSKTKINTSKINAINKIQRYILNSDNNVPYSDWKKFAVSAQQFIKSPIDDNVINDSGKKKKNTDIDEVEEILNLDYKLYSINLSSNMHTVKIIDDKELDQLTRVVSHLILVRLEDFKTNYKEHHPKLIEIFDGLGKQFEAFGRAITRRGSAANNSTNNEEDIKHNNKNDDAIYSNTVRDMFLLQEANNKALLEDLATFAWRKFAPKPKINNEEKEVDEEKNEEEKYHVDLIDKSFSNKPTRKTKIALDVDVLNVHIFKIFKDLLLLKQSIDSYTIIIVNLQRMVDVCTPLLLLFAYLYIFDFNFEDAMGFYISIVGIIGFFGSAYFSSVFASISFIMALNPFLVGDIISYDQEFYQVQEISLISCTFKHLQTGQLCAFQNKHLGESEIPIINLSRSEGSKLKYRWRLHFKHSVTNGQLNIFKSRCKELISKNKFTKNECHWSLKVRSCKIDKFQRKQINVSMKYDTFNNDVNSICFNYLTQAMTELSYQWEPLANMNNAQWFPLPPEQQK